MKFLIRKAAGSYRNWMYGWENGLANRSSDRIVRPFEFGLEWSKNWPGSKGFSYEGQDPVQYIEALNLRAIAQSITRRLLIFRYTSKRMASGCGLLRR